MPTSPAGSRRNHRGRSDQSVAPATSSPPSARPYRLPSGRPISGCPLTSLGSARLLPPAENSCRSSSDSKVCIGWRPASSRTAQSSRHRSPRLPGWLLHVTMPPIPRPWECRKPCRSCGIPPGRRLISHASWMTPLLRSSAITAVSALLRAAPSLGGASLLSASLFGLCLSLVITTEGSRSST